MGRGTARARSWSRGLVAALASLLPLLALAPSPARAVTVVPNVNVNRQAGNQSEAAIAIDPTNPQRLFVSSNDGSGLVMSYSTDGGATWVANLRISDGTSNGHAAGGFNFGDYTGLAFEDGVIHTVWSDNSDSTGDNADRPSPVNESYYERRTLKATYMGIEAHIDDAHLIGVPGLELFATGTVKFNKAVAADGTALTRMNWTAATGATNDPSNVLANMDIASAIKLQVSGSAALNIASALVAYTGNVTLTFAEADVTDGTPQGRHRGR